MDPVSFVASLEIEDFVEPSTPSHAAILKEGKDQAFVDAGSLVSFVGSLSQQSREDVLNSTMLAQLAANKTYDRYKDANNWYKRYSEVLENIGWVMQSFQFNRYQSQKLSFKISEAVLEILEPILADEELKKVVQATISGLAKSKDGLALFGQHSSSVNFGNFQIIPCYAWSGQVTAVLLGSHFESSASVEDYFFFSWRNPNINLFYFTEKPIMLNEEVYSRVREQVKKKLGNRAKDFVKDLDV